jgi:hypothetical protein
MEDRDSDSPLVADLRRRLRDGVRNPVPRAAVPIGRPADERNGDGGPVRDDADRSESAASRPVGPTHHVVEREGLGHGVPAPGGFKTV